MKKIGLIGGVGPESTIEYYRLIIKRFQERLKTKEYPEIIVNSINNTKMLGYVFNNQLDGLVNYLAKSINILENSGVDYAAIASNTPHIVFNAIKEKVHIPLISIVEETCREMALHKITRVGLFGTKSTMTKGFYNIEAKKIGVDIVIPESGQQDYIHDKYMSELIFNKIVPETKRQLIQIVENLKVKDSIEGLILGGTELPLILSQSDFVDIKIFDTMKIHVESIVTTMIEE